MKKVKWGVVNLYRLRGGQKSPAKGGHFERLIQYGQSLFGFREWNSISFVILITISSFLLLANMHYTSSDFNPISSISASFSDFFVPYDKR